MRHITQKGGFYKRVKSDSTFTLSQLREEGNFPRYCYLDTYSTSAWDSPREGVRLTLRNDIGYPVLVMTNKDIQQVTFSYYTDEGRTDYSDMGLLKDTDAFEVLGPGQEISFIMGYLESDSEVGIWGIPGNIVFF